ncbi:MAG: site-specific DNA-methyltransferase [Bdellovibrionota bacterium]
MSIEVHLNQVFQEDIFSLLKELPDKSVDMVYGDPDYNVGVKYGDKDYKKSFADYTDWYIELAKESLRVLKDTGNMFLINYPKQNAYLRVKCLDDACYEVSDYVWVYNTNVGHTPKRFTTAHRSVLHCRKTEKSNFYKDNVAVPYLNPTDKRIRGNLANGSKGRMPYDWFYFNLVKNVSREKTFHACQIPQNLAELLIKSCTMPNDTVLVLFGGSGSELEVCKANNRNFISAEIDEKYYKMILDRLNNGRIQEKYRLDSKRYEEKNSEAQLILIKESESAYQSK